VRGGKALAFEDSLSPRLAVRPVSVRAIGAAQFLACKGTKGTSCGDTTTKIANRVDCPVIEFCGDRDEIDCLRYLFFEVSLQQLIVANSDP
jgi:hypothetical protein